MESVKLYHFYSFLFVESYCILAAQKNMFCGVGNHWSMRGNAFRNA